MIESPITQLFLKINQNQQLTPEDFEGIPESDFLTKGSAGLNLLDWAIKFHHFDNIKLLLDKIDPNKCSKNCILRLFGGFIGNNPDKENITNITKLLLMKKCNIPSSDDVWHNTRLNPFFTKDAISVLDAARPPRTTNIKKTLEKARKNHTLTADDIEGLLKSDLLTEDDDGYNFLDWAVAHHNFHNILLLLNYIDPNKCKTNCFVTLFSSLTVNDPDETNIVNITILLLKKGCHLSSLDEFNTSLHLTPYCKDAKKIIHDESTGNIKIVLYKAMKNMQLTIEDVKNIVKSDFLIEDCGGFNPLDWAILHHNVDNIKLLLNYIDPNKCKTNPLTRLFRGAIGKLRDEKTSAIEKATSDITEITKSLLDKECIIPDDLSCSSPRLEHYYIGAKQAIYDDKSQSESNSKRISRIR